MAMNASSRNDNTVHICKFREWRQQKGDETSCRLFLDIREQTKATPAPGHCCILPTIVHIPLDELVARSFELPPRDKEFGILMNAVDYPFDWERLQRILAPKNKGCLPWKVSLIVLMESGDVLDVLDQSLSCKQPPPRLWEPDSLISNVMLPLLLDESTSTTASWDIWDLGAGSGRDAAYLAGQLSCMSRIEWHLTAVDHRYNSVEAQKTLDFIHRQCRRSTNKVKCLQLDLSTWKAMELHLGHSHTTPVVLYCVRFWKKQMVQDLAQSSNIPNGSLFGLSHFCKPHVDAPWPFAHPKVVTVIESPEYLNTLFQDAGWNVVCSNLVQDSDHGRTMIQFVAQKCPAKDDSSIR